MTEQDSNILVRLKSAYLETKKFGAGNYLHLLREVSPEEAQTIVGFFKENRLNGVPNYNAKERWSNVWIGRDREAFGAAINKIQSQDVIVEASADNNSNNIQSQDVIVEASADNNRFNISLPKLSTESHGEHRKRTSAFATKLTETYGEEVTLNQHSFNGGRIYITAKPESQAHTDFVELTSHQTSLAR